MSANTPNLGLFKYDPSTDGAQTFNVERALNENWDKVDSSILLALAAAAPYSTSQTYALGAYCTLGGKLYKCTTAITEAEAWTAAHWAETSIAAELIAISTTFEKQMQEFVHIGETAPQSGPALWFNTSGKADPSETAVMMLSEQGESGAVTADIVGTSYSVDNATVNTEPGKAGTYDFQIL